MIFRQSLSRASARLLRERGGNVAVSCAVLLPLAGVLAAVAVDEGALYAERRNMQGLTDLAAIAAANAPARAQATAVAMFRKNGIAAVPSDGDGDGTAAGAETSGATPLARVEPGRYDGRAGVQVGDRFVAGGAPANAVRVTLTRSATQYFSAGLIRLPPMRTVATAHASAEASFSVGSRLLAVHDGIANAVLGALLGAKVSLSVMDYEALAGARIDIPALVEALGASPDFEVATYSDLLRTSLPLSGFLRQVAASPGLDRAAAAALRRLAAATPGERTLRLGDLFDLGVDAGNRTLRQGLGGVSAHAAAADVVGAAAALASRGRQVEVALGAAFPGVAGVTLHLAIGEPMQASPWVGTGEPGASLRTAQTRLLAVFSLGIPAGPLGAAVRLPVYVEAAQASARLAGIRCETGRLRAAGVSVAVTPGLGEMQVADLDPGALSDFHAAPPFRPAALVNTPLARVTASGRVALSDAKASELDFDAAEITAGTVKQARSGGFLAAPAATLLGSLRFEVDALGAGAALPSSLGATLKRELVGQSAAIDGVLASVLDALGVALGEADVVVNGGTCRRAVLVQ